MRSVREANRLAKFGGLLALVRVAAVVAVCAAAVPAHGKAFLWQVVSKGRTSYLLGSVHVANKSLYPLPAVLDTAFGKAAVLVLEAVPEQSPELLRFTMQNGMYVPPDSLGKHVSAATLRTVQAKLKAVGLPVEHFSLMRPWLLAITLQLLELQRIGFDPALGIDQHFYKRAKGRLTVQELEGAISQLKLLSGLSATDQEQFLRYTILESDLLAKEIAAIMRCWRQGDAKGMQEMLTKSVREHPEFEPIYEKFITARNLTMAARIHQLLQGSSKTHFIIVGAAHLVGPKGLVQLLARKGYTLRQL